uniref:CRAL-TRIO domain-containing protein n=1 Tax=Panagrellus redivivus TaxID=6233 RepID=A0A7E4VT07_PANRE
METRSAAWANANGPRRPANYHGTLLVFFNFHHGSIDVFNLRTRDFKSKRPVLRAQRDTKHRTFMNYVFNTPMHVDSLSNFNFDETKMHMEIDELFQEAAPLLEKSKYEIAQVYIIFEYGDFPSLDDFRRHMKKFPYLKDATEDVKVITQNEAVYAVHLYEAGYRDGISDKAYMLFFRQTTHRVDAVLFRQHDGHLCVVRSINRFMDKVFGLDEAMEILDSLRSLKYALADCEVNIFEVRRRGGEAVFAALLDGHRVVTLPWENRRAAYMNAAYERCNIDLDVLAEKDREALEAARANGTTMQQGNNLGPVVPEYDYEEDSSKFPLSRPSAKMGHAENVDPYCDSAISPLQYHRFLRCAKMLPLNKQSARVSKQRLVAKGPVEGMPPIQAVKIMCHDALKLERVQRKTEMNFDKIWLEKYKQTRDKIKFGPDYEAIVDEIYGDHQNVYEEFNNYNPEATPYGICKRADLKALKARKRTEDTLDKAAVFLKGGLINELTSDEEDGYDSFSDDIGGPFDNPLDKMRRNTLKRNFDLRDNFLDKHTPLPPLQRRLIDENIQVENNTEVPEEDEAPMFKLRPSSTTVPVHEPLERCPSPPDNDVPDSPGIELPGWTTIKNHPQKLMRARDFLRNPKLVDVFPRTSQGLRNDWDAERVNMYTDTGYSVKEPPILIFDDISKICPKPPNAPSKKPLTSNGIDQPDIKPNKEDLHPTASHSINDLNAIFERIVQIHATEEPSVEQKMATADALSAPLLPQRNLRPRRVRRQLLKSRIRRHPQRGRPAIRPKKPKKMKSIKREIKEEHPLIWRGKTVIHAVRGKKSRIYVPPLPSGVLQKLLT